MISDTLTTFLVASTALSLAAPGSVVIGDVVDLGDASARLNDLDCLYLVVLIDADVTSAGAATVAFELVTDVNSGMATPTVLVSSAAHPKAALVNGFRALAVEIPKAQLSERYLAIRQTTGVAALTAGQASAFLTRNANTWRAFADGLAAGQ